MPAGRPKAMTLYKKKGSNTWKFFKPGFGTVDTGHVDRVMAERMMRGVPAPNERSVFDTGGPTITPSSDPIRSALSAVAAQSGADPFAMPSASDGDSASSVNQPPDTSSSVRLSPSPEPDSFSKPELAVLRKLSGAKREKIIGMLGTGAARLNATILSLGFGIAGFRFKDSWEGLSDEDMEIVKLGYDMWLDDVLDNIELKPAYVILIGNALLAANMATHAERKPKKTKTPLSVVKDDGGGNNGPATGT